MTVKELIDELYRKISAAEIRESDHVFIDDGWNESETVSEIAAGPGWLNGDLIDGVRIS